MENDNENLTKFIRTVKQYTTIGERTTDILRGFAEGIDVGETEVYEGQKYQEVLRLQKAPPRLGALIT